MATYDELRQRADSIPIYWFEVGGIPFAGAGQQITEANKTALFGDAYTPTLTFWNGMEKPTFSDSKSLEPLGGLVPDGGFEVGWVDQRTSQYPNGRLTWLFGSRRPSIQKGRLAADVALDVGGAGHDWTFEDATVFTGFPKDLYCGTETVQPQTEADPLLEDVVRSRWKSEATAHRGVKYGSKTLYPFVTDHPTVWKGRIVTLFQTWMDGGLNLATTDGTSAGVRAAAHRIRGILRGIAIEGMTYKLRCSGIESLLDRELCRKLPKARLGNVIRIENRRSLNQVPATVDPAADDPGTVMEVQLTPAGGGLSEIYPVFLGVGDLHTPESFIQAINDFLAAGPVSLTGAAWSGQLTFTLNQDDLDIRYLTDGVSPQDCQVWIEVDIPGAATSEELYWSHLGIAPAGIVDVTKGQALGASEYRAREGRLDVVIVPLADDIQTLRLEQGPDDDSIADFNVYFGGLDDGYVAIESEAGIEVVAVMSISPANGTIQIDRRAGAPSQASFGRFRHISTADKPVTVQRVYVTPQQGSVVATRAILPLLLSTGHSAYNDAEHDILSEGVGIAIPQETLAAGSATTEGLLDIESFERFFSESAAYLKGYLEVIMKPVKARDWLRNRLAFLGGALVVENGQLKARRTVAIAQHEGRVVTYADQVEPGARVVERSLEDTIEGVHFHSRFSLVTEKFRQNVEVLAGHVAEPNPQRIVDLEDKGAEATPAQLRLLGQEMLADLALENPTFQIKLKKSCMDLEPGMGVRFSDEGVDEEADPSKLYEGLPNTDGTRGHGNVSMLVTKASVDHGAQIVDVTLLALQRKKGGYSPSAWIETLALNTPVATTTRLVYTDRVFSDFDAEGFVVGEKVKVVRVSCPTAAVQESAGHTITAIDTANRRIEISPNVAGAGIVSGETLMLIHDVYQTAGQPDSAKAWCALGDASGDIGDTGDDCYDW